MNKGYFMIAMVLSLLSSGVGANLYLVYAASKDPSFAVEPGYYEKAVHWDEGQAERSASDRLGWRCRAGVESDRAWVMLFDDDGQRIEDAAVELEVFHNARARERVSGAAGRTESGYALPGDFQRRGHWVVRVRAERGTEHFVHEIEVEKS